jgi:hypothetical protein
MEQLFQNFDLHHGAFVTQTQQYHVVMRFAFPVHMFAKILIARHKDPPFFKSLFNDGVIV